jgi:hypothetical protein
VVGLTAIYSIYQEYGFAVIQMLPLSVDRVIHVAPWNVVIDEITVPDVLRTMDRTSASILSGT